MRELLKCTRADVKDLLARSLDPAALVNLLQS
jgi:hypothetical protein